MASALGDRIAVVVGCGAAGSRVARILTDLGVGAIRGIDPGEPAREWPSAIPVEPFPPMIAGAVWFVCSPASSRVGIYRDIVDSYPAGVFVEKPIGAEGDLPLLSGCVKALTSISVPNQIGYCWRWHPGVAAVAEWITERRTETLEGFSARAVCACDMSTWPGAGARSGSVLGELSHELDTLRYLLGGGDVVAARTLGPMGYVVTIQHDAGAVSTVELRGDATFFTRSLDVRSRDGAIGWHTFSPDSAGVIDGQEEVAPGWKPDDMFRDELRDFLKAVVGGPTRVSLRSGLAVLRWCADAARIVDEGGPP